MTSAASAADSLRVDEHASDDDVARAGAAYVAQLARAAVAERGHCYCALSGGRTPWVMLGHLSEMEMPWASTSIYQVDERIAPADDPARNLVHLRQALAGIPATIVPMPVNADDLDQAMADYSQLLPEAFDIIHLGLGPDGHTASLVPEDRVLTVTDRLVARTEHPYQGHYRMTLTYPVLNSARQRMWLVTGSEKQWALAQLLAGDRHIPAGRVNTVNSVVMADRAALA